MKSRDKKAQFACAWLFDERQILVFLWHNEEMGYYISCRAMDPTLRLGFELTFADDDKGTGEEKAWVAFESIRCSLHGARENIENIFESMFEKEGKDHAERPEGS